MATPPLLPQPDPTAAPPEPVAAPVGQQAPAIQTSAYRRMDDATSHKLAQKAEEVMLFYDDQLTPLWERQVRGHNRYHLKINEWRNEVEKKWRSNMKVPKPFMTVEGKVAQLDEIMTGGSPIIQATSVGSDDRLRAQEAEKLIDYTLEGNHFRKQFPLIARTLSIGGTEWMTNRYEKKTLVLDARFTPEDKDYFDKSVEAAVKEKGAPPPPDFNVDPEGFEQWRKDVNSQMHGEIPEPPLDGPREIVRYEGPVLERVPGMEMRFDPLVQEVKDQPYVIRRMIRSRAWLDKLVARGIFDANRVKIATDNYDGERLSTYENEIAQLQGYSVGAKKDPSYQNSVEILIVYDQRNDEWPYQVILNRAHVINMRPDQLPYIHGDCEFVAIRNLIVPGFLAGMSDLQQPEGLFHELDVLRNLRLDGVYLSVLPAIAKSPETGLTEVQRQLVPGAILNVRKPQDIKKLIDSLVPEVAYRELNEIAGEIDETTGITGQVRGAQATINRVSANEQQSRMQSALLRIKMNAKLCEEDMNPMVTHWLALWHQFGKPELISKATGIGQTRFSTLRKQDLLDAFRYDMRFRGATRAIARDKAVAELTTFLKEFGQQMAPIEVRSVMVDLYQNMGLEGVGDVVQQKYTQILQGAWEAQQMGAVQAAAQQQNANAAQQAGAPATVDARTAAAMGGGQ